MMLVYDTYHKHGFLKMVTILVGLTFSNLYNYVSECKCILMYKYIYI